MKKLWKIMLSAALMSGAVCLFSGMGASAQTYFGKTKNGYTTQHPDEVYLWTYDDQTETLTVAGENVEPDFPAETMTKEELAKRSLRQVIVIEGITDNWALNNVIGDREVPSIIFGTDYVPNVGQQYFSAQKYQIKNPSYADYDGAIYTKDYADAQRLAAFLISLAVAVFFADPIRELIPLNILVQLMIVHAVYIGVRWWRSTGY